MKWHPVKQFSWRKLSRRFWQETSAQKTYPCHMLEVYEEIPISIHVDITQDVVKLVAQKLSGSSGPGGTDLEDLYRWFLKFGEGRKKLRISVEIFVDQLTNKNPPWEAYNEFKSIQLIVLDKQPGVCMVRIG